MLRLCQAGMILLPVPLSVNDQHIIRVPTQVLHGLIFVFPFVRPYKVLFLGYFHPKGPIKSFFFIVK